MESIKKAVTQFLSKGNKSVFHEDSNTIILSDYGSSIERVTQIIEALDVPNIHNIVEVVPITYAPAIDLTNKINTLIWRSSSSSFSGVRRTTNLSKSKSPDEVASTGVSALIPDERTNSIIISGTRKGIERIKSLIRQLDSEFNTQTSGGIFVYYVKYGVAEDIAKTLNEILQPQAKKSGNKRSSGFSYSSHLRALMGASSIHDDIQITHDSNTNSLLITAKKHSFQALKSILEKIDIPKHQVFIKTIIMDLNAENSFDWDITTYKFLGDKNKNINGLLPRIGFSSVGLKNLLTQAPERESILSFATGLLNLSGPAPFLSGTLKGIASGIEGGNSTPSLQIPSLLGLVNIIKSTAGGNILSTPQLIAVDNEESSISVGVNAPVGTSKTLGGTGELISTAQERQDINTELKITPRINPDGNSVRLSIEQKIDSISPTTAGSKELKDSVTITKRKIVTNIILKDRETAVLGGLMHDEEVESNYKIPLLGDIPLLGWLFKAQDLKKTKKNLIVFITPQIIKSTDDTRSIMRDHIDERIEFMKQFMNYPERNEREMYKILGQSAPSYSSSTAIRPPQTSHSPAPYFPILQEEEDDDFLMEEEPFIEATLPEIEAPSLGE